MDADGESDREDGQRCEEGKGKDSTFYIHHSSLSNAVPGSVAGIAETVRTMHVTTSADGPRLLLVSQKWDKDYVAEVDGKAAPVLRCNYLCLGVPVPAGRHEVVIRYAPSTWHLWVQGAGLLVVLGAGVSLVVERVRRG